LHGPGDPRRPLVREYFHNAVDGGRSLSSDPAGQPEFLVCSREIDGSAQNRGFISLMRRPHYNLKPDQKFRLLAYLAEPRLWTSSIVSSKASRPTGSLRVPQQNGTISRKGYRVPQLREIHQRAGVMSLTSFGIGIGRSNRRRARTNLSFWSGRRGSNPRRPAWEIRQAFG
jgi:hypothetical protein